MPGVFGDDPPALAGGHDACSIVSHEAKFHKDIL